MRLSSSVLYRQPGEWRTHTYTQQLCFFCTYRSWDFSFFVLCQKTALKWQKPSHRRLDKVRDPAHFSQMPGEGRQVSLLPKQFVFELFGPQTAVMDYWRSYVKSLPQQRLCLCLCVCVCIPLCPHVRVCGGTQGSWLVLPVQAKPNITAFLSLRVPQFPGPCVRWGGRMNSSGWENL